MSVSFLSPFTLSESIEQTGIIFDDLQGPIIRTILLSRQFGATPAEFQ